MPQHEQSISTGTTDSEKVLAIVYTAMQHLKWNILYAGSGTLSAANPKNWKTNGQQIICKVAAGELTVVSAMTHGELSDLFAINKKNTAKMIQEFEVVKNSIDDHTVEQNKIAIEALREGTVKIVEQQKAEAEALNSAMNLAGSNLYLTYALIAINVLIFILMIADGAGFIESNPVVHIKWGSDYSALTLSGDWWRLFTSTFVHFGIIHLAMNMYCLYTIGVYLEPMLGKLKFITAYVCTGILASLISVWWHIDNLYSNSAGASGAIFGMYGVFLALLSSNLIPKSARMQLLQSIGIFVAYNLLYGTKSGVDNAAHIGGLVSGFVIGFIYIFSIKKEKQQEQKLTWLVPAIVLITAGIAYGYLQQNIVDDSKRTAVLNEIKEFSYSDNEKFNAQLGAFDKIHNSINEIVVDTTLTSEGLIKKINETGLPQLSNAEQLIKATGSYDISPASHDKAKKLTEYISLRKNELELMKKINEGDDVDSNMVQLNDTRERYQILFEEIANK